MNLPSLSGWLITNTIAMCLISGIPIPVFAAVEGDTTAITVTGTIIDTPQCTVGGKGLVEVDFGDDVYIYLIDGKDYKKKSVAFTLTCQNMEQNAALKMAFKSTQTAGFGSGLLGTSKEGLGIRLYNGNMELTAGTYINFNYTGSSSDIPMLYAVPVKKEDASLTSGFFYSSGTMIIDYQ